MSCIANGPTFLLVIELTVDIAQGRDEDVIGERKVGG